MKNFIEIIKVQENLPHLPTSATSHQDIIVQIQVVHQLQVKSMHSLIRVWFSNSFLPPNNQCGAYILHWYSDGGYAKKSWKEQITAGIADNKEQQEKSLAWSGEQSLNIDCIESLANHDPDITPHIICL